MSAEKVDGEHAPLTHNVALVSGYPFAIAVSKRARQLIKRF